MFVETIIAMFTLGFLACAALAAITIRQLALIHRRHIRALTREQRMLAYRAEMRTAVHKGTPYISPAPSNLERLLADIESVRDDHNASRRAPDLRVVS